MPEFKYERFKQRSFSPSDAIETQTKKKKKAAVSKCISSHVFSVCGFK